MTTQEHNWEMVARNVSQYNRTFPKKELHGLPGIILPKAVDYKKNVH